MIYEVFNFVLSHVLVFSGLSVIPLTKFSFSSCLNIRFIWTNYYYIILKMVHIDLSFEICQLFAVTPSLIISDSAASGITKRDHKLTCNSGVSRPVPTLNWYKNGLALLLGNNTQGYSISHSITSYSGDLYIVESVLTIQRSWYNDGDVVTCQASNDASFEIVATTLILSKGRAG